MNDTIICASEPRCDAAPCIHDAILAVVAKYTNPTVLKIARELGVSHHKVTRACHQLAAAGLVATQYRDRPRYPFGGSSRRVTRVQ